MQYIFPRKSHYRLAQISDCHLLADEQGVYQQIQPAKHLRRIIDALLHTPPDALILTGDLTQDHSAGSYRLLAEICRPLPCPVFCLPGNHDDLASLAQLATQPPFHPANSLRLADWQLLLLNTKGPTPSGVFPVARQRWLRQQLTASDAQAIWLFCHHQPIKLHSFIDKHGQQQRSALWQTIAADPRIAGIAHGHSHYAYSQLQQQVNVVGCPASSVQFLASADWQTRDDGPQWCDWQFGEHNSVQWQFRRLTNNT